MLGKTHDRYVLLPFVAKEAAATIEAGPDGAAVESLTRTIDNERLQCMVQYRKRVDGQGGLLREWEAGLPQGKRIGVGTAARLRTTAQALDPAIDRTFSISRRALQQFDQVASRR